MEKSTCVFYFNPLPHPSLNQDHPASMLSQNTSMTPVQRGYCNLKAFEDSVKLQGIISDTVTKTHYVWKLPASRKERNILYVVL